MQPVCYDSGVPTRERRSEYSLMQTEIVYLKPPADGALPDPASTFNVVHTPFETPATNLQPRARHPAGNAIARRRWWTIAASAHDAGDVRRLNAGCGTRLRSGG